MGARMMYRILVPLDQSQLSRSAVPLASALALASGAELVLLTVMSDSTPFDPLLGVDIEDTRRVGELYLSRVEKELRGQGISTGHVMLQGDPETFIVLFAATQAVDLIVMATHARGGVNRWSLGSVADEVMRTAPVPVLLTRSETEARRPQDLLPRRILIPLDGSPESESILPHARAIADVAGSDILLLRVLQDHDLQSVSPSARDSLHDPDYDAVALTWETRRAADYLESVARRYRIPITPETIHVRVGEPHVIITATAIRERIDLIALSTHGRSGLKRFAFGSVATQVLSECPVPMLTTSAGAVTGTEVRADVAKPVAESQSSGMSGVGMD
jgi:nucleotide-binding universal stress UspA family protein